MGGGPGGGAGDGWKAPDYLPDHLRGKDAQETLTKVSEAWKGFRDRDALATGKPPAAPTDYKFEQDDASRALIGDLSQDKTMDHVRGVFHKHGLSQAQFQGVMKDLPDALKGAGLLKDPYDAKREIKQLGDILAPNMAVAEQKAITDGVMRDVLAFSDGLAEQLKLSPAAKAELDGLNMFAGGVELLNSLRQAMGAGGQNAAKPGGGPSTASGWTKETLRAAQQDPRYDPNSPKYDPAFVADVKAGYARLHRDG